MIAVPAVDIRDGACVQLVGGSYADERVRLADPVGVARRWQSLGFVRLHLVDLDAAMGVAANTTLVEEIIGATDARVSVGGGIRTDEQMERLLARGAARVVVGTRALRDPEWLAAQARRFPNALVVAADVRDGRLAVDGWTCTLDGDVGAAIAGFDSLPLAAVLVTAVDAEGRMRGPAMSLLERVVSSTIHPVIASGGVTTLADISALASIGVAECVIGMALYTETLDAHTLAREFGR